MRDPRSGPRLWRWRDVIVAVLATVLIALMVLALVKVFAQLLLDVADGMGLRH